jgi:hypothetical protein
MVDLPSIFWNQVHEQLKAWYREFSDTGLVQLLAKPAHNRTT